MTHKIAIEAVVLDLIDTAIKAANDVNAQSEPVTPSFMKFRYQATRNIIARQYTSKDLNREIVKQDTSIVITDNFVIGEPVESIATSVPTKKELVASRKGKIINIAS